MTCPVCNGSGEVEYLDVFDSGVMASYDCGCHKSGRSRLNRSMTTSTKPLTTPQQIALWIIEEHGPIIPSERRKLIDATYTDSERGRAFVLSSRGAAELESFDRKTGDADA